jgi:hypothetical protein
MPYWTRKRLGGRYWVVRLEADEGTNDQHLLKLSTADRHGGGPFQHRRRIEGH